MEDRIFIADYLHTFFDEVEPKDFYREIFPIGELEEKGVQVQGKYNAIAVELLPKADNKVNAKRYIVTDEMSVLDELLKSENFIIVSPISYAGKSRKSENARFIYAMAIDLDGITNITYLRSLIEAQIQEAEVLPKPTYIVWSGTGIHLYYQFEQPLPCFKNIVKQLADLKKALTEKIWNGYTTELYEKPQLESLFQGFRLVGGVTKGGNRTRAFEFGDKVSIEYLNSFVPAAAQMTEFSYKSELTLADAKKKYPEWYQKRIEEHKPRGTWTANRAVYDWWLKLLQEKIEVGHRYYAIMILAIYAKKCGIDEEELEKDAYGLIDFMENLTVSKDNHFTREDVLAALEMFNDNYITFPIDSIVSLTAIPIEKNKRNYRKQEVHLGRIRKLQEYDYPDGEWRNLNGRPKGSKNKKQENKDNVRQWRKDNPNGSIKECIAATGISQATVYRYWKIGEDE